MLQRFLILLAALVLTACAYSTPPRTDPLADLLGGAKLQDAPTKVVTEAKAKSLGLIVSTSAETQIRGREEQQSRYLDDYIKKWEPRSYGPVKTMYDSIAPRALIDATVLELRSRFRSVEVVGDLAEFRDRKLDLAAVVDVGMEAQVSSTPLKNAGEFTTEVKIHFFDTQIRRVVVASGSATGNGERGNTGDMVSAFLNPFAASPTPETTIRPLVDAERRSREEAFRKLRASLDSVVR